MLFLSKRIDTLEIPMTIEMTKKSRVLQDAGHDIISLSLGEPDFDTPDFIKTAGKEGIDQNYSHYMPVPGYLDLREAISKKFKRDNNLDYQPNEIIVSTGAKQSIANIGPPMHVQSTAQVLHTQGGDVHYLITEG